MAQKKSSKNTVTKMKGTLSGLLKKFSFLKSEVLKMKQKRAASFRKASLPHGKSADAMVMKLDPSSVAKSAVFVLLMLLLFYFMYDIRGILLIFFVSFLLAAACDPVIDWLETWRIPRPLAIVILFVALVALFGMFITNVATLVADQVVGIAQNVGIFVSGFGPDSVAGLPFADQLRPYVEQFLETVDVQAAATQVQSALQILSSQILSLSLGLFNLLIVLILTFFMTADENAIEGFFRALFPSRYGDYISTRIGAVKDQVGLWLRGQVMVSLVAGIMSYVGLVIMGVDYALTLSLIAGISMVVPVVGRFFAWIVTFPIVFNQDPMLSLWMSLYYLIIQQFENNLIVPYVMNKAVGLSPIIIIFAMMVGQQYLGILGLVLSVPVATTVAIFVKDYTNSLSEEANS